MRYKNWFYNDCPSALLYRNIIHFSRYKNVLSAILFTTELLKEPVTTERIKRGDRTTSTLININAIDFNLHTNVAQSYVVFISIAVRQYNFMTLSS